MSSTHRSSVSRENVFKLDSNGNIDADKLSKEMTDALAFDIDYKKKDNMKKRAIKSAPDYDAFRNMVACASLKTVRLVFVLKAVVLIGLHSHLIAHFTSIYCLVASHSPKVDRKLKVSVIRRRDGKKPVMGYLPRKDLILFLDKKH